jgi:hypothetical protein
MAKFKQSAIDFATPVVLWAELCRTAKFCQKPAVARQLPKGVWQNLAEPKSHVK